MSAPLTAPSRDGTSLPTDFLNAYEIVNSDSFRWSVNTYSVLPKGPEEPTDEGRGGIKNAVWTGRKLCRDRCPGMSFVVPLDACTVAVGSHWDLPVPLEVGGFVIEGDRTLKADPKDPEHRPLIAGILQESVKLHFKGEPSAQLGPLWQDYGDFCQMPDEAADREFFFCRKFVVTPKLLRGNRWVLLFKISTVTVDGMTLADYFRNAGGEQVRWVIET